MPRQLVRGARVLGGSRGVAAPARPGAGRSGDRRRRVRLRAAVLPPDARRGCGRRPAGRRHALRRDHRPARASARSARPISCRSRHTARPQLHAHAVLHDRAARHLEHFHDHARIERMLFDGGLEPERRLAPSRSRSSRAGDRAQDPRRARPSPHEPPAHPHAPVAVVQQPAPGRASAALGRTAPRPCRSASRSTSTTTAARSATSGCGRPSCSRPR